MEHRQINWIEELQKVVNKSHHHHEHTSEQEFEAIVYLSRQVGNYYRLLTMTMNLDPEVAQNFALDLQSALLETLGLNAPGDM